MGAYEGAAGLLRRKPKSRMTEAEEGMEFGPTSFDISRRRQSEAQGRMDTAIRKRNTLREELERGNIESEMQIRTGMHRRNVLKRKGAGGGY